MPNFSEHYHSLVVNQGQSNVSGKPVPDNEAMRGALSVENL